ncbi:MAG: peroxiredoxin [Isosphaeraceae bacterium]
MHRISWIAPRLLGVAAALAMTGALALAEAPKVGDPAPAFSLQGSDGKTYSLADFKGKSAVVLAWFPKAFTPGCTKECKSFAQGGSALKGLNVAYFTASVDAPDYNKKFAESLDCDYPILSDPDKSVAKAYGVVHEGRPVPERWTFYIDKEGIIRAIDKKVDTSNAAADAAAKLKELGIAAR